MQFGTVRLTVNYPNDSAEAAIPDALTDEQLLIALRTLFKTEPDMTSFVLVAAVRREAK